MQYFMDLVVQRTDEPAQPPAQSCGCHPAITNKAGVELIAKYKDSKPKGDKPVEDPTTV